MSRDIAILGMDSGDKGVKRILDLTLIVNQNATETTESIQYHDMTIVRNVTF